MDGGAHMIVHACDSQGLRHVRNAVVQRREHPAIGLAARVRNVWVPVLVVLRRLDWLVHNMVLEMQVEGRGRGLFCVFCGPLRVASNHVDGES